MSDQDDDIIETAKTMACIVYLVLLLALLAATFTNIIDRPSTAPATSIYPQGRPTNE